MTQPVMTKGHKWWLYSSTAMALLAWSIGGTVAQADQTPTPTTPATDQAADATNQTLQEAQVTLPTAATGEGAVAAPATSEKSGTDGTASTTNGQSTDGVPTDEQTASESTTDGSNAANGANEVNDATDANGSTITQDPATPTTDTGEAAEPTPAPEKPAADAAGETTPQTVTPAPAQSSDESAATPTAAIQQIQALAVDEALDENTDIGYLFKDANFLAAVRVALNLKDGQALTLKVLQAYRGEFQINSTWTNQDHPINSLSGLEVVAQNLNATVRVSVDVTLGVTQDEMPTFDFSPLTAIQKLGNVGLHTFYWGAATDDQLRLIAGLDPQNIQNLSFTTPDSDQKNLTGMTSRQLAILAPFVASILDNSYPNSHAITFSGNSIADFSSLGIVTHLSTWGGMITGRQQYVEVDQPLAIQPGGSAAITVFTHDMWGRPLLTPIAYHNADGQEVFTPNQQLVNPNITDGQVVYGQLGWQEKYIYRFSGKTDPNGVDLNGDLTFTAGTTFYQKVGAVQGQTITVTYQDDTTGTVLSHEELTGDLGTTSDYQTAATLQDYQQQGYEVVSDGYPAGGATFTDTPQTFVVHLKHGLTTVNNSKTVTQWIHYQYADGTPAATSYTAWVTFVRQGQRDQVTGQTQWADWHPTSPTAALPARTSPVLAGYTADQLTVPGLTLTPEGQDVTTVVTYTANGTTPVDPTPDPEPEPTPDPDPDPEPTPNPEPDPEPTPNPAPTPQPKPTPTPGAAGDAGNAGATATTPQTTQPGQLLTGGNAATTSLTGHTAGTPQSLGTTVTGEAATQPAATKAATLPQTNEAATSVWGLLGGLLLTIAGAVGFRRRHS
ncbi:mucin-binding protein [Levilactobacillus spicheri]|uniref:mucin-binding protein n=1 Tax=Levilactobacillus spicheri TaxID=216463 RepID=UPI000A5FF4C6|nr:LPXTG cell wall anchor domain-containing protein [Levilactobacillus spicheri]